MKHLTCSLFVSMFFVCSSGVALAADLEADQDYRKDQRSIVVKYSDLDLTDAADAKTLLERVQVMTKEACKRSSDMRDLTAVRQQERCVQESYQRAVANINRQTGIDTETLAAGVSANRNIAGKD